MRVAIINDGYVGNIIVCDSMEDVESLFPGFEAVESPPDGVQIGDSYNDGMFGMEGANTVPKEDDTNDDIYSDIAKAIREGVDSI